MPDLNETQRAAVESESPAILCVAGPGAGKTRVLTHRVAHLIDERGTHPTNILCLTFTNKAAAEMRDRVITLVGRREAERLTIGTFHSVGLGILRTFGNRIGYEQDHIAVYDEVDRADILKAVCADRSSKMSIKAMDAATTDISCRAVPEEDLPEEMRMIFLEYNSRLLESNALDFSGILLQAGKLIREHEDVRQHYRRLWRHVLIDEYQDTDRVQYNLHSLLDPHNLFCVGDPDQSIYGFRGADQSIILQFQADHEDSEIFRLDTNYRSTNQIVDGAMRLIKHNVNRIDNTIRGTRDGAEIKAAASTNRESQGHAIASAIRDLGEPWSQYAVLYRKHKSAKAVSDALDGAHIPYQILTSESDFYGRDEVHRFISLLRLIRNKRDNYSLSRIINWPAPRIKAVDMRELKIQALQSEMPVFDAMKVFAEKTGNQALTDLALAIDQISDRHADNTALGMAVSAELAFHISGHYESKSLTTRAENVRGLLQRIGDWCDAAEPPENKLSHWLDWFALRSQQDGLRSGADTVKLLSIHAAKGLEWPCVFIVDATQEDHLPGRSDEDVEEERRIFYVAATRAADRLFMTWPETRLKHNGMIEAHAPVRFISEMGVPA